MSEDNKKDEKTPEELAKEFQEWVADNQSAFTEMSDGTGNEAAKQRLQSEMRNWYYRLGGSAESGNYNKWVRELADYAIDFPATPKPVGGNATSGGMIPPHRWDDLHAQRDGKEPKAPLPEGYSGEVPEAGNVSSGEDNPGRNNPTIQHVDAAGNVSEIPKYIAAPTPEERERAAMKAQQDAEADVEMQNAMSNILGFEGRLADTDDLPEGSNISEYFTESNALTKWENIKKSGKLQEFRMLLFNAGYYYDEQGNRTFDFSEAVTQADIAAMRSAMGDANLADPTRGGRGASFQPFLKDQAVSIQDSLSEQAMLKSEIKEKLGGYGLPVTSANDVFNQMMQGRMNYESLDETLKARAKQLYPVWSDQIDSGMNMNEIASPYRESAASILEVPYLDFDDPLLANALNSPGKDGKPSYQSLTEFKAALRDDSRWEYTQDAHNYYGGLSNQIMETWGM